MMQDPKDFGIQMGSDESHFSASLNVKGRGTKECL